MFQILEKDVFWFSKDFISIQLPATLLQIEYGALVNPDGSPKASLFLNEEGTAYTTQNFGENDCVEEMDLTICMWCFMHFYGLHRRDDNLEEVCRSKQPTNFQRSSCYWTDPPSLPKQLEKYAIPGTDGSVDSTRCPLKDNNPLSGGQTSAPEESKTSTAGQTPLPPNSDSYEHHHFEPVTTSKSKYWANDAALARPLRPKPPEGVNIVLVKSSSREMRVQCCLLCVFVILL